MYFHLMKNLDLRGKQEGLTHNKNFLINKSNIHFSLFFCLNNFYPDINVIFVQTDTQRI